MSQSKKPRSSAAEPASADLLISGLRDIINRHDDGDYSERAGNLADQILEYARSDREFMERIIEAVIPSEASADTSLYDRLASLNYILSHNVGADELCGLIWRDRLMKLDREAGIKLLTSFPSNRSTQLFQLLDALPTVLDHFHVPAVDAIAWFERLREAIGEDLANEGYWLGIDSWTKSDPENATDTLRQIPNTKANAHNLSFGARILANLRLLESERPGVIELTEFDESWASSHDSTKRKIYHHSWVETVILRGITETEVLRFLQLFDSVEGAELGECFNFIRCLIVSGKIPAGSIDLALQWLRDHVTPEIDPLWKHWICIASRYVWADQNSNWTIEQRNILRELIIDIQPILLEHEGTWREVNEVLAHSIRSGDEEGVDFIQRLYDRHPESFTLLLDHSNRSLSFFMELAAYPRLQELIANLFSERMDRRRFGLSLINSGLPLELPEKLLNKTSEWHLALGLLQIRFDQLNPQQTCSLLLQLLPRIEKASTQLQDLFSDELAFQSRNLPGLCLERFKKVESPSPLLKSAIAAADSYFKKLRTAGDSPVAAMHVPGLKQARRTVTLRQSRQIDEQSREGSVFLKFMKSVHLIYGREGFAHYQEGRLSEPTPFQSFTASTEIPRLDLMDYDGQKLRRHQTLMQIRSIEEQLRKVTKTCES